MAFASSAKGAVAGFASASLILAASVLASSPVQAADDASPGFFSGVLSSVGLRPTTPAAPASIIRCARNW